MAKTARSARGVPVDFDLLTIKAQLATQPVPVSVNARRKFIDEKDGVKAKESFISPQPPPSPVAALAMATQAAEASALAAEAAGKLKD